MVHKWLLDEPDRTRAQLRIPNRFFYPTVQWGIVCDVGHTLPFPHRGMSGGSFCQIDINCSNRFISLIKKAPLSQVARMQVDEVVF
jgi:hypothetical protein